MCLKKAFLFATRHPPVVLSYYKKNDSSLSPHHSSTNPNSLCVHTFFSSLNILQNHLMSSFSSPRFPSQFVLNWRDCSFNNLFYLFPMSFLQRWNDEAEWKIEDRWKYLMSSWWKKKKRKKPCMSSRENKTNDFRCLCECKRKIPALFHGKFLRTSLEKGTVAVWTTFPARQLQSCTFLERTTCAHNFETSNDDEKSGKENSICNDFWVSEKSFSDSVVIISCFPHVRIWRGIFRAVLFFF